MPGSEKQNSMFKKTRGYVQGGNPFPVTSCGRRRNDGSPLQKSNNSVLSFETTYYSKIPERNDDLHVITQEGDRLDNLAFQYYKNPNLWWYIAQANNISSMNVEPGIQLRIPISTDYIQTK